MSKLRISTLALAVMVAAGAAFPFAVRADETKTTTAALKHRWTFNTDLKDSATGRSAVKIGANVAVADGFTLQGATVTVNGVKLDVERNITYSGSDTQVKLVFGMPQEAAVVVITPVQK